MYYNKQITLINNQFFMKKVVNNTNKITVEVNSTSGAFKFISFNSLTEAKNFCKLLKLNSNTLSGIIYTN